MNPADVRALWARAEPPVFGYPRITGLELVDDDLALLNAIVEPGRAGDVNARAADYYFGDVVKNKPDDSVVEDAPVSENLIHQAALLVQGMAHGVLAARSIRAWSPDRDERIPDETFRHFAEQAVQCVQHYAAAWPLPLLPPRDVDRSADRSPPGRTRGWRAVAQLLDERRHALGSADRSSALLALRSLLDYLLDEETAAKNQPAGKLENGGWRVHASLLGAYDNNSARIDRGIVITEPSPLPGYYLDPVLLGLRLLDHRFRRSIHLGWRCCRAVIEEELHRTRNPAAVPRALRIGVIPSVPDAVSFSGGSAGGLLAWAMFAGVHRLPLDEDASASIQLGVREGVLPNDDSPLTADHIQLLPVGSLSLLAKLQAARRGEVAALRQPSLKRVLLCARQTVGPNRESLDTLVGLPMLDHLQVNTVSTFDEALRALTRDARIEHVLSEYGAACAREWNTRRNDDNDPDFLKHYIDPHFSVERREGEQRRKLRESSENNARRAGEPTSPDDGFDPVSEPGDSGETELVKLLRLSRRLCVFEDAGAGKTILTRRLLAFLGTPAARKALFDGKACLAVRLERGKAQAWPRDFRTELLPILEAAIQRHVPPGSEITAETVAKRAVEEGRVVLILDAIDQVGDSASIESLCGLLDPAAEWPGRVILTGRAWAANRHRQGEGLLHDRVWRMARIERFDLRQQYEYLRGIVPVANTATRWEGQSPAEAERQGLRKALEAVFPSYDDVAELLRVPVVLSLIRRLHRQSGQRDFRFRTRGELYLQVHEKLTVRAAAKLNIDVDGEDLLGRWREILAATAFEMMMQECWNYTLIGRSEIRQLRIAAAARRTAPTTDLDWRQITFVTDCTDHPFHPILERADETMFGFTHRGMMEFYAGIHLAANTQPGWCQESVNDNGQPIIRCGDSQVASVTNDENWYWAWRFAIELPPKERFDPVKLPAERRAPFTRVFSASLSELFRLPSAGQRPTELIYRAWHYVEADAYRARDFAPEAPPPVLPQGALILAEFRGEFQRWLSMPAEERADGIRRSPGVIARELVCLPHERPDGAKYGFVECPPPGWHYPDDPDADPSTFLMGSPEGEPDRRPVEKQHSVTLTPFWMQTTTVTREQYRLFDPQVEILNAVTYESYAPQDQCPVIEVSWWDAFVFARWLGPQYCLPSEAQWEYGCRAGTKTATAFGNSLGSPAANFDGEHPYNGASVGPYIKRTTEVGAYAPNDWQLYDMHGNVWEWCWDWYADDEYGRHGDGATDPLGPSGQASLRVLRGGCWDYDGGLCRSACRRGLVPELRVDDLGFRLAAVR